MLVWPWYSFRWSWLPHSWHVLFPLFSTLCIYYQRACRLLHWINRVITPAFVPIHYGLGYSLNVIHLSGSNKKGVSQDVVWYKDNKLTEFDNLIANVSLPDKVTLSVWMRGGWFQGGTMREVIDVWTIIGLNRIVLMSSHLDAVLYSLHVPIVCLNNKKSSLAATQSYGVTVAKPN